MGDPRGAERKARKRKRKLNICQSLVLGVFWGLASTSYGWRRLRASSACDLPWFLPSLCTRAFLPAVKGKGHFRVELHNLFGRAIFTGDRSLIRFPVRSHEESSCHICESRTAGRASCSNWGSWQEEWLQSHGWEEPEGGCSDQSVEPSDPHGMDQSSACLVLEDL